MADRLTALRGRPGRSIEPTCDRGPRAHVSARQRPPLNSQPHTTAWPDEVRFKSEWRDPAHLRVT
jgi:hypothetical protein